ncbi:hypothetical protein [Deinococcus koreensis]|uniref:Uncharacterized protein n=1 Tax=Deinococcus koreensis TaxID=2054903 RepID=A0A2K3V2S6_9DEIO|nr:hypothetical protein [Deinococcus koreensis]PNY83089.1 hypothetical protein CVO96_14505 [Deinococcus koreensis]
MDTDPSASTISLTAQQWDGFLASLYERDDRLELREAGQTYPPLETVDAYVMSAHAEALLSGEVEGDLWGTLEDIEETASSDEEAWQRITDFYLSRGCVLIRITGLEEPEEWILSGDLARRLGLPGGAAA